MKSVAVKVLTFRPPCHNALFKYVAGDNDIAHTLSRTGATLVGNCSACDKAWSTVITTTKQGENVVDTIVWSATVVSLQ